MHKHSSQELQVVFDHLDRSALVVMGDRTATIPYPVSSQREANILGRELALRLGWFDQVNPSQK